MKYEPHEYQRYAINYIEDHPFAAVLLDMGLGKSKVGGKTRRVFMRQSDTTQKLDH